MTATLEVPNRLSILDDESDTAAGLTRSLERQGYTVVSIQPSTPDLESTVEEIMRVSDAALCDHALKGGFQVSFSGAEVVAELTRRGFPSVLFTGVNPEERYAIRRNMAEIPGFIHRDNDEGLRPTRVLSELLDTVMEVKGGRPPARRRARRTPVTVLATRRSGHETLMELSISGWPRGETVEVPADLLAQPWCDRARDAIGMTFFAMVNLSEDDENKLFYKFESEPAVTDRFTSVGDG